MGNYLTDMQMKRSIEELPIIYSLLYVNDLMSTAWEQILADITGGLWSDKHDNRPRLDVVVFEKGDHINGSS